MGSWSDLAQSLPTPIGVTPGSSAALQLLSKPASSLSPVTSALVACLERCHSQMRRAWGVCRCAQIGSDMCAGVHSGECRCGGSARPRNPGTSACLILDSCSLRSSVGGLLTSYDPLPRTRTGVFSNSLPHHSLFRPSQGSPGWAQADVLTLPPGGLFWERRDMPAHPGWPQHTCGCNRPRMQTQWGSPPRVLGACLSVSQGTRVGLAQMPHLPASLPFCFILFWALLFRSYWEEFGD